MSTSVKAASTPEAQRGGMPKRKRIGEILLEHGVISKEQLQEALALQKTREGKLGQILMSLGYLSERDLLECLSKEGGVTSVDISNYAIDPALTQYVPREFAWRHEVMPMDLMRHNLTLAMAVPLDLATRNDLEAQTGFTIRAVLCERSAVMGAIEQYYGIETDEPTVGVAPPGEPVVMPGPETVRLKNLMSLIDALDTFPLLPDVHLKLLNRLEDPEVPMDELTGLVERDPALTANVLRIANSAAYASRDGISRIDIAITRMGFLELRHTVMASAVMQRLSERAAVDVTALFDESHQLGLLSRILSERAQAPDRDAAHTAGLLSNIGRIALHVFSPEYESRVREAARAEPHESRAQIEERLLGICASELGYHLAEHWRLPVPLANAIRYHDRLDHLDDPPPVTVAVAAAHACLERFVAVGSFGPLEEAPALAHLLALLGLPEKALEPMQSRFENLLALAQR